MRKKLSDMTKQYSSFFLCVILCCLAAEFIGPIKLSLGRFTVTFLPLLYAMLLMLVLYLAKPVRGVGKAYVPAASRMLSMGVVFAMAKLGISSGASIKEMISASPILILQNIGNIGTVLFALPIALILGMKREAVGMSYVNQEPDVYKVLEEDFGGEEYGIGFRLGDQALMEAVNDTLQEMREDGTFAEIVAKWPDVVGAITE